ncbi:MAG: hypothetical protein P8166_01470 [Candidatus Thiodiazotropha sp.]
MRDSFLEYSDAMSNIYETCVEDDAEVQEQDDRIHEYEKNLEQKRGKPMLAAMFLLYFVISVSLMSLIVYWMSD